MNDMTFQNLRKKNPNLALFPVTAPEFSTYGRVMELDTWEICVAAGRIPMPESGSVYHASEPCFEILRVAGEIQQKVFGALKTQVGYCYGYNRYLNATEWHASPELNIAVTDLVLILGRQQEIDAEGKINSAQMKAFYLPARTAVEIYSGTLHFCPCQTQKTGFGCVVGLPEWTNLPLDAPTDDPFLFRRNKWLLAHEKNYPLIARGARAGVTGENLCVMY